MFIKMIYILDNYQHQGLLRPVLLSFHDLLAALPEWYAFAGTLLLVPARPDDKRGEAWGDRTEEYVEEVLKGAYQKHGGYEVWANEAKVSGRLVTVMGKVLPDTATAGEGVDEEEEDVAPDEEIGEDGER